MSPKRKKAYFLVIGLCGIAMLVDRLILPSPVAAPEEAMAGGNPGGGERSRIAEASKSLTAADSREGVPELPFPRNLIPFDRSMPIRDLFANEEALSKPSGGGGKGKKAQGGTSLAEEFGVKHQLEAVLVTEGRSVALVDGKLLEPGIELDGCRLIEVTAEWAKFECADGSAVLTLSTFSEKKAP